MDRKTLAPVVILALTVGCGGPSAPAGPGSAPAAAGSDTVGPPAGFGAATFTVQPTGAWPLEGAGPLPGSIQGWNDTANADQWVQLFPDDRRFVFTAADWPRAEGPADLTAACNADPLTRRFFDSCSFHFTEMKLGDVADPALTGGTYFFHGTFSASKGGVTLVTATF